MSFAVENRVAAVFDPEKFAQGFRNNRLYQKRVMTNKNKEAFSLLWNKEMANNEKGEEKKNTAPAFNPDHLVSKSVARKRRIELVSPESVSLSDDSLALKRSRPSFLPLTHHFSSLEGNDDRANGVGLPTPATALATTVAALLVLNPNQ